jgi:hypothetical protein
MRSIFCDLWAQRRSRGGQGMIECDEAFIHRQEL